MITRINTAIVCLCLFPATAIAQPQNQNDSGCIASGNGFTSSQECISKDQLLGALDLSVPTNPLFTLLGSTPENVINPKTSDEIAFSVLPQAVNAFGEDQFAFAIELNPGLLLLPETISTREFSPDINSGDPHSPYQFEKILSLFTLTTAISRTTEETNRTQYGAGINFNYDTKSPYINNGEYRNCVSETQAEVNKIAAAFGNADIELRKLLQASRKLDGDTTKKVPPEKINDLVELLLPAENDEDIITTILRTADVTDTDTLTVLVPSIMRIKEIFSPALIDQFDTILTQCLSKVSQWNRTVFGAGAAVYHTDIATSTIDTNTTNAFVNDVTGFGFWGSLAIKSPLKINGQSNGQFTIHGRYTDDLVRERGSSDNKISETVDSWLVASRYTHQFAATKDQSKRNARAFRGFIEVAYSEEDFSGIEDEFWQAGIGAEIQIRKDAFFQLTIGDTFGSEIDRSTYLSGQFKWSFSKLPAN